MAFIALTAVPVRAEVVPPEITIPTEGKELIEWVRSGVDSMLDAAGVDRKRFPQFESAMNWVTTRVELIGPHDRATLGDLWDWIQGLVRWVRAFPVQNLLKSALEFMTGLFEAGAELLRSITK